MEMHSRSKYSAGICCNQLFWFAMLDVANCGDCTHVLKKKEMGLYSLPEHKWFAALVVSVAVGYAPRTKGLVSKTRLFPASCVRPFVNLAHCTSIILITLPLLPILLLQYQYKRIISPSMLSLPLTSACNVRPLCDDGTVTWIESISVWSWLKLTLV